jgi:hypothetical protein
VDQYTHEKRDIHHPIFETLLPETPRSIHKSMGGKATTEQRMTLRVGMLTQQNNTEVEAKGTPKRLLTTLATKIELTCLTHTHSVWLERNKEAETEDLRNDTLQRLRHNMPQKRPTLIDIDDTENRQTAKWESERNRELGRLEQWKKWGTNKSHTRLEANKTNSTSKREYASPTGQQRNGNQVQHRGSEDSKRRPRTAPMDSPNSASLHSQRQRNAVRRQSPYHACHTHTPSNLSGRRSTSYRRPLMKLTSYFFGHACQQTRHYSYVPIRTS